MINGFYVPATRKIYIRKGIGLVLYIRTYLHELCHFAADCLGFTFVHKWLDNLPNNEKRAIYFDSTAGVGSKAGQTDTTIQTSDLYKQLAPLMSQYSNASLTGANQTQQYYNSLIPQLMNLMSPALTGAPTSQMQQNASNTQQQVRQSAAQSGMSPGDPRLMQQQQQSMEALTQGAGASGIQTILSLFGNMQGGGSQGMQGVLNTMNQPAGQSSVKTLSQADIAQMVWGKGGMMSYN